VCLESIFQSRYGDLDTCPKCGVIGTKFYKVTGRKCYACKECSYQLHPLAQTIFHKSHIPLTSWFYVMYLFSVAKNGVAAKEVERHLGVSYETAHRMCKQIRTAMAQGGMVPKLSGTVEADETYFGARKWNRGQKYNADHKTPILGAVEKKGRARIAVTDVASTERTKSFLSGTVAIGSTLHTDESPLYAWTKADYYRQAVKHSALEYARDGVHTNTIEGFWGQLKRSINGTYHHVSKSYLQNYVDEFVFRYNHRGEAVYPVLLAQVSRRVL